jgi:hypothetical protein
MGDIPKPGTADPDFSKVIQGITSTMGNLAAAFNDWARWQRELEDKLLKQENLWQSYRDRVSNLPPDIAFDIYSDIVSALNSMDSIGSVHRRIKDVLAEAEGKHWKKCAEWLLAERDWKSAQPAYTNITIGDVAGFDEAVRRRDGMYQHAVYKNRMA